MHSSNFDPGRSLTPSRGSIVVTSQGANIVSPSGMHSGCTQDSLSSMTRPGRHLEPSVQAAEAKCQATILFARPAPD